MSDETGAHARGDDKMCALTCCPCKVDLGRIKSLVDAPEVYLYELRANGQ
jgi:hypothetical protein